MGFISLRIVHLRFSNALACISGSFLLPVGFLLITAPSSFYPFPRRGTFGFDPVWDDYE